MRFLLFIVMMFSLSMSYCQPNVDTAVNRARVDKYYVTSYYRDYRDIVLSPFRPTVAKYTVIAAFAGSSYMLISKYDKKIQQYVQDHRSETTDELSGKFFERVGSGMYLFPGVVILYGQGLVFKNQKSKKVAMNCAKSFIIASSFAQVAKYSFGRQRPHVGTSDPNAWFTGNNDKSYFSGHTTTAFSIATVVAEEYRSTVWVPIVCYALASGVAFSRVNDNKHWASDVLAGAFTGYMVGRLVVRTNNWGIRVIPRIIIQPQ